MENTEANLYRFYHFIGKADLVRYVKEEGYYAISSPNGLWPQTIFQLDKKIKPEKLIPKISKDIINKNYPRFFIAPKDYIHKKHASLLKENNIVPVLLWKGMVNSIREEIPLDMPEDVVVRQLYQQKDFGDFADLVNEDLMVGQPFDKRIWEDLASEKKLQLFGLFLRQKLVSAIIAFYSDNIAGLYFLATAKNFRGRGYGTFMMQHLLNKTYLHGAREVILHTNGNALKLHEKVGFKTASEFVIYRKF